MQSETGFPSSHQLKSYVAYKSGLKLAARAVLSADADLLVIIGIIRRKPVLRPTHASIVGGGMLASVNSVGAKSILNMSTIRRVLEVS